MSYTRTDSLALKGKGALLLGLLGAQYYARGTINPPQLALPSGVPVVFVEHIGSGASARAFKCTAGNRELVVKWFNTEAALKNEVRCLQQLKDKLVGDQCIPTLIHHDLAVQLVALSPVARKLSLRLDSPLLTRAFTTLLLLC